MVLRSSLVYEGVVHDMDSTTHALVRVPQAGGHLEVLAHDPTPGMTIDRLVADESQIFYLVSTFLAEGGSLTQLRVLGAPGEAPQVVQVSVCV